MSHDYGRTCQCRATHRPHPLELNLHHIWPSSMGGPDTEDNLVAICPTTHANIHELLRIFLSPVGPLSWGEVGDMYDVPVSRYAFDLAHEGYRRVMARSVTP